MYFMMNKGTTYNLVHILFSMIVDVGMVTCNAGSSHTAYSIQNTKYRVIFSSGGKY